jgi:hypothetical protein
MLTAPRILAKRANMTCSRQKTPAINLLRINNVICGWQVLEAALGFIGGLCSPMG